MTLTLKETKEDKIKVYHEEKAKQLSIYNSIKQHTCPTQQHNEIPATLYRHPKVSYGVP